MTFQSNGGCRPDVIDHPEHQHAHDKHEGHDPEVFRRLFWWNLALAVPVLVVALGVPRPLWPLVERWPWKTVFLAIFLLILAAWGYTMGRDLSASGPR